MMGPLPDGGFARTLPPRSRHVPRRPEHFQPHGVGDSVASAFGHMTTFGHRRKPGSVWVGIWGRVVL